MAGNPGRIAALAVGAVIVIVGTAFVGIEIVEQTSGEVHQVERRTFADAERVRVSSDSGDIRVVGTTSDLLEVEGSFTSSIQMPEMSVRQSGGAVEVSADCGTIFFDCNVEFEVRLPAGVTIAAETSSGNVEANDLVDISTATLRTSSGNVSLRDSSGDMVTLRTSSGNVDAEQVAVTDIDARTSSGDVDVITTISPRTVDARTSSGDVTVVVPYDPAIAYDVDVDTSSGEQEADIRTDPASDRSLRASTSSGDVSVVYASEP